MREPVQSPDDPGAALPPGASAPEPGATPGQGLTTSSKGTAPGPRLPHERDESAHEQRSTPQASEDVARQAHADAESGMQDTSYGQATDAAYHAQVTPGSTTPPPRRTGDKGD